MKPNLILPTEHPSIELRQLHISDAPQVFRAIQANRESGNQHLVPTKVDREFPNVTAVEEQVQNSIDENWQYMGIFQSNTFVGSADLGEQERGQELGYWLDERYTGRGYATIAVNALSAYAIGLYGKVVARSDLDNHRSHKVLLRSGFHETDRTDEKVFFEKK